MRAASVLLYTCAIVLAGGCSGTAEDRPVRSVAVGSDELVEIGAREYRFDPGRIVVRGPGRSARVRISMRNRGKLAHNIQVREADRDLASTPSFPPGQERSLRASLPPGDYELVCTVGDHEDLGMVGTLVVQ